MKMINAFPVLMGLTVIAFAFGAEVDGPKKVSIEVKSVSRALGGWAENNRNTF